MSAAGARHAHARGHGGLVAAPATPAAAPQQLHPPPVLLLLLGQVAVLHSLVDVGHQELQQDRLCQPWLYLWPPPEGVNEVLSIRLLDS